MKKIIFLSVCALFLSFGAASAQNSLGGNGRIGGNYNNFSNVGSGIYVSAGLGIDSDGCFAPDLNLGYLYPILPRLSFGGGLGIINDDGDYYTGVKLYGSMRYGLPLYNNVSLVTKLNLGYCWGLDNEGAGNFIYEPYVGIGVGRFEITLGLSEFLAVEKGYGYDEEYYYLVYKLALTYNF